MLATFYLTGPFSASTLSDTFTITGEPGGIVHSGVLKAQLLTGHTIVFVDSVTGGTVTATNATCEGTSKTWAVIQATPTPTPTPTAVPGQFGYTTTFGSYPVTSQGYAILTVQNTTSTAKYLYLRANSTYVSSGNIVGSGAINTDGFQDTVSISDTISATNQTFDSPDYLYVPAGSTYTITVTHSQPSAGSFYLTYTDDSHPTKTNIPLLVS